LLNLLKTLVIGYGSIGQRHARLLTELECEVAVVSSRSIDFSPHYYELSQALGDWKPEYIVVANRTNEHHQTLETLVKHGFQGSVLVEKPLFDSHLAPLTHNFSQAAVAYNLRCHPLLLKLKSLLDDSGQVITANIYVGSYLPDWRPNTDYRQSYSAKKDHGGGVLRDLSHELDYALWLFGPWRRMTASGGSFSSLEIDGDDAYTLLIETQRCPLISIQMNYLDRPPRREILVNTNQHTIKVDLIKNSIEIDGVQEFITVGQDDTYRAEHQAMLAGSAEGLCTLEEAMEILLTIDGAERATTLQTWITQ
jgi:predicted dehydrogenase